MANGISEDPVEMGFGVEDLHLHAIGQPPFFRIRLFMHQLIDRIQISFDAGFDDIGTESLADDRLAAGSFDFDGDFSLSILTYRDRMDLIIQKLYLSLNHFINRLIGRVHRPTAGALLTT